jgi:penicillin-binding protein 1B
MIRSFAGARGFPSQVCPMIQGKRYWRRFLRRGIPILVALILPCLLAGYFFILYVEVNQRFESRRWSIPSRVFSATVPLYPGMSLSIFQMKRALEDRRYKETIKESLQAGEYKLGRDSLIAYLREFRFPAHVLPAQRVEFTFKQSTLVKIKSGQSELAFLELEPLEIVRLFGPERKSRLLINIKKVPAHLIDGVLAVEDHRFYEHRGVDWWGTMRALYTDIIARRVVQGGSTITQQLVKNYFLEPERTFKRKLQEASMAVLLEALYEKDAILEMYMNEIYMGQKGNVAIHGMGEAAISFFGRNVEDLTLAECATLAGMIRAPNSYSPLLNREDSIERRNTVLKRMLELGMIPALEYEKARGEPRILTKAHNPRDVAPYYVDYVRGQLQDLYDEKVLGSEGLSIYTALHPEMAVAADMALREELPLLERELSDHDVPSTAPGLLQGAIIVVQPKTGEVLALVGGRDYGASSFNRALFGHRQPGSAIMPFVYLTALDQFTPVSWLNDDPVIYKVNGNGWSPRNIDDRYRGPVLFRDALEESLNAATVNLAVAVGLEKIITMIHTLGIESPIQPVPSSALGDFEATPLELAGAYATLDNDGQKPHLLSVKEVVTESGEIQDRRNVEFVPVTTPARAYLITNILAGGSQKKTVPDLKGLGVDFPCAAKSGVSSGHRDSWFVGYTTDLLIVIWVGYDDHRPVHLSGSRGPARIWARFIDQVRPWFHPQEFLLPPDIEQRLICVESGKLAGARCREQRLEVFLSDTVPKEYCTVHQ